MVSTLQLQILNLFFQILLLKDIQHKFAHFVEVFVNKPEKYVVNILPVEIVVSIGILPGGSSSIIDLSKSPKHVSIKLLGIGVAVINKQ